MIDPLVSLAFSVQSNKGVYALLLGSGISRSAQIPTGWEIVLDLIGKLAILEGEDCEPDPAAWYKDKFSRDPDYSELLDAIAKSPAERNQLLKAYFEPNDEEREEGNKLPTAAHKAIAKMVARGYLRVIMTTNFDHLLEKALAEEGIEPTVISTADSVNGALPLVHTNCTIIKVNGDYLDTRIKNTRNELASYDEEIDKLLDRVFDEFGLIVCGWSGDWDIALRSALERCKNHRFTTYWTDIQSPTDNAKKLIELRRGELILIQNADAFFDGLAEKIFVLEEYNEPHPLSVKALVAQVKKYIVDERYEIRLHDLVNQEVERLYKELFDKEKFPFDGISNEKFGDEFRRQVKLYESLTKPVLAMMITGCRWGKESHEHLWVNCLERIANPPEEGDRRILDLYNLRLYPALLLLYGAGIASIAAGKYSTFSSLLTVPKIRPMYGEESTLVLALHPWSVMDRPEIQRLLPGLDRNLIPLSNHLNDILRDPLRDILPQDANYQDHFNRFEYLAALVHADLGEEKYGEIWAPVGLFGYRSRLSHRDTSIMNRIQSDFENSTQTTWPPLRAGLFGGSAERFKSIKQEFDELITRVSRSRW
jgi:hypothetical protein